MKNRNKHWLPIVLLILLIALAGWYYSQNPPVVASTPEQPVSILELAGPIAVPEAELSGLAWHGKTLILLPQYPERFGKGDGALFALSEIDIQAALKFPTPLEPKMVVLNAPGLKESIPNFQGYEAIVFHGDQQSAARRAGHQPDRPAFHLRPQSMFDTVLHYRLQNHARHQYVQCCRINLFLKT